MVVYYYAKQGLSVLKISFMEFFRTILCIKVLILGLWMEIRDAVNSGLHQVVPSFKTL